MGEEKLAPYGMHGLAGEKERLLFGE